MNDPIRGDIQFSQRRVTFLRYVSPLVYQIEVSPSHPYSL